MTTIPARLARTARPSGSPEIARKRVIQLYRDWYRSVSDHSVLHCKVADHHPCETRLWCAILSHHYLHLGYVYNYSLWTQSK